MQGAGYPGQRSQTAYSTIIDGTGNSNELILPGYCQITPAGGAAFGVCAGRNDLRVDWFGTVRGRLGCAIGNTLIYGTGGFAAGGVRATSLYTDNNIVALNSGNPALIGTAQNPPQVGSASHSATNTGWTAGAGIEVKITPNWSLKGEYQFIDLGTISAGPGDITMPTAAAPFVAAPCTSGAPVV